MQSRGPLLHVPLRNHVCSDLTPYHYNISLCKHTLTPGVDQSTWLMSFIDFKLFLNTLHNPRDRELRFFGQNQREKCFYEFELPKKKDPAHKGKVFILSGPNSESPYLTQPHV